MQMAKEKIHFSSKCSCAQGAEMDVPRGTLGRFLFAKGTTVPKVLWAGTPSSRAGCSELHPSWPQTQISEMFLSWADCWHKPRVLQLLGGLVSCCHALVRADLHCHSLARALLGGIDFVPSLFGKSHFKLSRFWPELLDLHILLSHSLGVIHHPVMDRGGWMHQNQRGDTEISPEPQNLSLQWSQWAELLTGLHYSTAKRSNKAQRIPREPWWDGFSSCWF